jgi:hypothetical protein
LEPRLIPKRNLSGDTAERVDTRVLQVIYRVADREAVYDGELMDVFIEVPARLVSSTQGSSTAVAASNIAAK